MDNINSRQPSGLRIIFMGTPDFAVASLAALINAKEQVVAVVTAPDKPAGRGQKIMESAVKQYAIAQGIPVLQPEKLRDQEFLRQLKAFHADIQVVVAFRMLPEIVWGMPPQGTINLHASLLPQYRGAAPINHAIINGEHTSGVTTFLLQHEIDTGNILLSEEVAIAPDDTAGDLHDKLMFTGASLLVRTVQGIAEDTITPTPQKNTIPETILKHAPKIFKEDCVIDWQQTAIEIHNKIRGLSPYPTAYTFLGGKTLKVFRSKLETTSPAVQVGTMLSDNKTFLKVACADGYIFLEELQLEGKKRMQITEFLRGYKFP